MPEAAVSKSRHTIHLDAEIVSLIPALRAFARTFCRDQNDANDLVQETLMKALSKIHRFEEGTRLKSWLFTIMRNTFYNKVKLAAREAPDSADCASSRLAVNPPQEWSTRGREVSRAIEQLPQQQREVLVLIGVLGASYEEAAEICGCAMGTIKSRLSRARVRLLEKMGETSALTQVEAATDYPVDFIPKRARHG